MRDVLKVLDRLGPMGRIVSGGIAVATIAVVFYLVMSAGPSAYAPAFTNLTPKQAGDIEAALTGASIVSKLGDNGTSVMVPSSQIGPARIALAQAGLTVGGEHPGWSLVDKLGMSATQWQQDVGYQRALEGELANQMQDIAGVQHATVNLTMPKQSLFLQDQQQPTASVLLNAGGGEIPSDAVRGIQRLVAGAVSGLTVKNVVVTNERGMLISDSSNGIGDAAASKLATEADYSRRMEANAQALLDQMLGPGQSAVVVNARLGLDQITQQSVTYGKNGVPVSKTTDVETLKGTGAKASGAAGTASNVPGYAAGSGAAGNSNYSHKKGDQQTAVNTTTTNTTRATGDPTHLFVSVAFAAQQGQAAAGAKAAAALNATQKAAAKAVQAYLGIAQKDIAAGTATFQTAVSAAPAPATGTAAATTTGLPGVPVVAKAKSGGMLDMAKGYARPAIAAIGVLLLLFLSRRALKRRQALLSASEARWMPSLAAPPIPVDEIALPTPPTAGELEGANKKALQARVEDLAAQRPAEVAQQLRGWLTQES